MEHRCGRRRAAWLAVTLRTTQGVLCEGWIRDISSSGALVVCNYHAPVDVSLLVRFRSDRVAGLRHLPPIRADVVRRTHDGFALEWQEFSPSTVRSLLRLIAQGGASDVGQRLAG